MLLLYGLTLICLDKASTEFNRYISPYVWKTENRFIFKKKKKKSSNSFKVCCGRILNRKRILDESLQVTPSEVQLWVSASVEKMCPLPAEEEEEGEEKWEEKKEKKKLSPAQYNVASAGRVTKCCALFEKEPQTRASSPQSVPKTHPDRLSSFVFPNTGQCLGRLSCRETDTHTHTKKKTESRGGCMFCWKTISINTGCKSTAAVENLSEHVSDTGSLLYLNTSFGGTTLFWFNLTILRHFDWKTNDYLDGDLFISHIYSLWDVPCQPNGWVHIQSLL